MKRRELLAAAAGTTLAAGAGCTFGVVDWDPYPPGVGSAGVIDDDVFAETVRSAMDERRYLVVEGRFGLERMQGVLGRTTLYVDAATERYYGESEDGEVAYYGDGTSRYEFDRIEDRVVEREPAPFVRQAVNPRHPDLPFFFEWEPRGDDPFDRAELAGFSLTDISHGWARDHPRAVDVRDVGDSGIPPDQITLHEDGLIQYVLLSCSVERSEGWDSFRYSITTGYGADAADEVRDALPEGEPEWL